MRLGLPPLYCLPSTKVRILRFIRLLLPPFCGEYRGYCYLPSRREPERRAAHQNEQIFVRYVRHSRLKVSQAWTCLVLRDIARVV